MGSASIALESMPTVFASALEERVEQRRMERLGDASSASSSSSSSYSALRYRTRRSSSSATLEKRVEMRLQERLGELREEITPEEYADVIAMLERRQKRRETRLAETEESLQLQVADAVNRERAQRGIPALL